MVADNIQWLAWWHEADIVIQSVFILLISMSLLSWGLMSYKAQQLHRIIREERQASNHLMAARELEAAKEKLHVSQPSYVVLDEALKQPDHYGREALSSQLSQKLQEERLQLESGLTLLATIGNSAPFIGLFGTVWGIMHALHTLGGSDIVLTLDTIAGPVSEALAATAAGIFTAVPAVIAYNLLVRRIRFLSGVMEGNATRILNRRCATGCSI